MSAGGAFPGASAPRAPAVVRLVEARVHGRYLLRGPSGPRPRPLLVGTHGYGENADLHLEALEGIPGLEAWWVASVQGLHPFYRGRSGEVVASWMTRLDRERAIADNAAYLRAVVEEVRADRGVRDPLVFAGFSQGTAMAYRAAVAVGRACAVLALGGDVPPELAEADLSPLRRVLLGRGSEDTWYDEEKLGRDVALLGGKGVSVEVCRFDGGHAWTAEFRARAGAFLAALEEGWHATREESP